MKNVKNIALVHDWLVSMRGGEKVLEVLCELFPKATLFSLVQRKGTLTPVIERMHIKTSFIQKLPSATSRYQYYLPLFPTAIQQFDLCEFDLVISSSHAAAKGVRVRKDALHICYCHTPMRYIWDQYEQYFGKGRSSLATRTVMNIFLNYLRGWDVKSAESVNHFIANSHNVQERIKRIYHRNSEVIYPPVDVQRFPLSTRDEGYYLIVSALVPYKRIDLAVEAFNSLGERLVIIGSGGGEQKLKLLANKNVEFLGWVNDEDMKKYYSECRALIFPGEEDFGIVPVEAMACGKPVVAFGRGGVLETVVNMRTGVFFKDQTVDSLMTAIKEFKGMSFDKKAIRDHSFKFDTGIFKTSIANFIQTKCDEFFSTGVS
jgi:glycosyltransferase involved in cell wall biosynthesis